MYGITKDPKIKAVLKKNKPRYITHPDFELYYKAIVIKIVWSWPLKKMHGSMEKNRKLRIKSPHIRSIFGNEANKLKEEKIVFSTNGIGKTG